MVGNTEVIQATEDRILSTTVTLPELWMGARDGMQWNDLVFKKEMCVMNKDPTRKMSFGYIVCAQDQERNPRPEMIPGKVSLSSGGRSGRRYTDG
jgi:hypothetical protein